MSLSGLLCPFPLPSLSALPTTQREEGKQMSGEPNQNNTVPGGIQFVPECRCFNKLRDEHPNLVPGPSATGSERKMETEVERRKEMKIKERDGKKGKERDRKKWGGGKKQKGNEEREREKGKMRKIKRETETIEREGMERKEKKQRTQIYR